MPIHMDGTHHPPNTRLYCYRVVIKAKSPPTRLRFQKFGSSLRLSHSGLESFDLFSLLMTLLMHLSTRLLSVRDLSNIFGNDDNEDGKEELGLIGWQGFIASHLPSSSSILPQPFILHL